MLLLYALAEMRCKGHILSQEVLHNIPYPVFIIQFYSTLLQCRANIG